MKPNRRFAVLSALTGGLLAGICLPMATAFADEYDFSPNGIYDVTQVEGYPPLDNEFTGYEFWNFFDVTKNTDVQGGEDALLGTATETQIGSFSNDDFLNGSDYPLAGSYDVSAGTQIDLTNFGGGFENEWINIPTGADAGTSDLLITPFGDFQILGTAFSDIATIFNATI